MSKDPIRAGEIVVFNVDVSFTFSLISGILVLIGMLLHHACALRVVIFQLFIVSLR